MTWCYWLRKSVCVECSTQQSWVCAQPRVYFSSNLVCPKLDTTSNLLCLCPGCVHANTWKTDTYSFFRRNYEKKHCVFAKILGPIEHDATCGAICWTYWYSALTSQILTSKSYHRLGMIDIFSVCCGKFWNRWLFWVSDLICSKKYKFRPSLIEGKTRWSKPTPPPILFWKNYRPYRSKVGVKTNFAFFQLCPSKLIDKVGGRLWQQTLTNKADMKCCKGSQMTIKL